jgi:hypothetical protein
MKNLILKNELFTFNKLIYINIVNIITIIIIINNNNNNNNK